MAGSRVIFSTMKLRKIKRSGTYQKQWTRNINTMNEIPENWRIDRVPTKWERIFTIIISGFLSALFGALGGLFAWALITDPNIGKSEDIYFLIGVALLFSICVYILIRAVRGKVSKPSAFKAKLIGYYILAMSMAFIPMALVGDYGNKFYLLSVSMTGIPMGISLLRQGKALEKKRWR